MRKIFLILLVLFAVCSQATAWRVGGNIQSKAGIVGFAPEDFPFVNFFKAAVISFTTAPAPFILPNFLTADQYPIGTISGDISYQVLAPNNYYGRYVLAVTGAVTDSGIGFTANGVDNFYGNVYTVTGSPTITGCASAPCYISNNMLVTGTNFTVEFDTSTLVTGAADNGSGLVRLSTQTTNFATQDGKKITVNGVIGSDGNGCGANGQWTIVNYATTHIDLVGSTFTPGCTYTSGGQIWPWQLDAAASADAVPSLLFKFRSGGTFTGVTNVVLCKKADYTADNTCNTTSGKSAWPSGFNDDFVQSVAQVRPRYIRYLDSFNQVFRSPPDWAARATSTLFTYHSQYWPKIRWLGSTSGTNTYTATCSAPCTYVLTAGEPADGDMVQAYTANANTNRTPTIAITDANSVTSSAWPISTSQGWLTDNLVAGMMTAGDIVTLTFTSAGCLGGGPIAKSYTVQGGDTANSVVIGLQTAIAADTTLTAFPLKVNVQNPNGGGSFYISYGIQACVLAIMPSVSGAATETVAIGNAVTGLIATNSLNTFVFSSVLKRWVAYNEQGVGLAWPYQAFVDLANAVSQVSHANTGCWIQINQQSSNAYVTSLSAFLAANPCSGGQWLEVGNEIWNPGNPNTALAQNQAAALALVPFQFVNYEMLRTLQVAQLARAQSVPNLYITAPFQVGAATNAYLNGDALCGTTCSNTAYQNYVGVDYNTAPTRPRDYFNSISEAPYTATAILNDLYPSDAYATFSATTSSISSNVLTVSGTVTGTIYPQNGITNCAGVYIKNPTPSDWSSGQLTGKVTTTLNGAVAANQTTWTLTSVAGLSVGMWIYNSTTGNPSDTIKSINAGAKQITTGTAGYTIYPSTSTNDSIVFGGKTGTYQLNSTSCSVASTTITGGDVLGLQYATDNYLSLGGALGSQTDALDWIYQDSLVATRNGILEDHQTLQSYKYIYAIMGAFGFPVHDYEGGYQPAPPTAAQALSMGLPSGSYGGANGYVNRLLTGFKNSQHAYNLETARHNQEIATLSAGSISTWFNYAGFSQTLAGPSQNNQWGTFPQTLYYPPAWQSRRAMCVYNGGAC